MAQKKFTDSKGKDIQFLFYDDVTKTFKVIKRFSDKVVKKRSLGKISEFEAKKKVIEVLVEMNEDFAREEQARKNSEKLAKIPQNKLFRDFYHEVRTEKINEGIREATIKRLDQVYRSSLNGFWGDLTPLDINKDKRAEFIKWHQVTHPGVQLFNPFKYLGNILKHMYEKGVISKDQIPSLDLPEAEKRHHKKKKGRIVPVETIEAIRAVSKKDLRLLIGIAYSHGLRKMEIAKLNRKTVKLENGKMILQLDTDDTKTGIARIIPVHESFIPEIKERLEKSYWVFPGQTSHITVTTVNKPWQKAKKDAGVVGRLRFHDLRHMCATNMAKAKINPIVAATLLGMSLKIYQQTYLNLSAEDLILAVEASPLFKKQEKDPEN